MAKRQYILAPIILIIAVILAAIMFKMRPEPTKHEIPQRVIKVEAMDVYQQSIKITLSAQGAASAHTQTTLTSEVTGTIIQVSPKLVAGGFFKKGEVLLKIDDTNYQANLRRKEADVASARSALTQELGRAEVAQKDWERAGKPGKTAAAQALAVRKPQLTEAQARLAAAIADLKQSKTDLEKTTIRAPYDGLVKEKQADIGRYVGVGTPLAILFAVDYAEVRLPLPENRLSYLNLPDSYSDQAAKKHPAVTLTATIGDATVQWQGELVRSEGVLNSASRALHLVTRIKDPYNLHNTHAKNSSTYTPLRIGTFVHADIEGKEIAGLIPLPRNLLRAGNKLWVIDENNTLREKNVSILKTSGKEMYVSGGLEDGDRICLTPVGTVLPGTKVELIDLKSQSQEALEKEIAKEK